MQAVIATSGLTKVYHSGKTHTLAVNKLDLQVEKGEIFGFLGPNGAGKTTTIRLLLDLIRPTAGQATIFGKDVRAESIHLHRRIGFMPGELNLWKHRTAQQVIRYIASIRGSEAAQITEAHSLAERLKFDMTKRIHDYSSGNRRKLGLILALMHRPELLILDEPTGGLDPLMQQIFNEMMLEIRAEGRTVFLSSHVLSEVQAICDRVGILRDGELKAVENVEKLTRVEFRSVQMTFRDAIPASWISRLQSTNGVSEISSNGRTLQVHLHGDFDPLLRVVSDGYIENIRVEEPTLEDIFLAFYGNGKSSRREREAQA